jgi:hypothetical protein
MDRTIPLFPIALAIEKEQPKPFRNALDKSDQKKIDGQELQSAAFILHYP